MRPNVMAIALLCACTPEPPPTPVPGTMDIGDQVLVTVDGHPVTRKMLDVSLSHGPETQRDAIRNDPDEQRKLLETLAYAELLYHRAVEANVHDDPAVLDAMALAQREIMANIMIEKIAAEKITDEAVQQRYEALGSRLDRPNARVHHILVEREDQAKDLVKAIKAGEVDFLDAARDNSIDTGIETHGGDLGWTVRPPIRELLEAWENSPEGEVVGPVEGRKGFHIIRVVGRRPNVPLEEVGPQIRESLQREAMQALRQELMEQATVEWSEAVGSATPESADAGGPR